MLAAPEEAPLCDPQFVYEPKYDGIRALVEVIPGSDQPGVRIWSRLGNEKTAQFPELVRTLERFRCKIKAPVLLDGEIVALDETGEPAGFQRLQGRIHLTGVPDDRHTLSPKTPVALIAFDVLRDGQEDLRSLPLITRRARLERIIGSSGGGTLRLSEFVPADGRALYQEARAQGREGLIAKVAESPYRTGRRSTDWRKLKIVKRQEFVIGGWTEPRDSRPYFGALLLGVYDGGRLRYVGHTGTGFNHAELARLHKLLRKIEIATCPFDQRPHTNERPHWTDPKLVAEIKFTEWTTDAKLRHPTYLGLRDDVRPQTIRRERSPRADLASAVRSRSGPGDNRLPPQGSNARPSSAGAQIDDLLHQLERIEEEGGQGILQISKVHHLQLSNLKKIFWPALRLTKGDLMRYYMRMSSVLLPAIQDRPLVMKRHPNGVRGPAFYQQRAPDEVPPGVRVEVLPSDTEVPSRLVGGSLTTLLYMVQLGVISQDPWFSRVQSPDYTDYVALDLDPMPGVAFARVLDVARWAHDELVRYGIPSVPKTSGATGLHIYIPLPRKTTYETGRLFCQILATLVAHKHPKVATVTRSVNDRGRKVYIDYLQNIRGKTLAAVYSARASEFAGASAPLTWKEVDEGVDPRDFTILTLPQRVRDLGDLWGALRASPGTDLRTVIERLGT
ncbi:MAG TPA: DNA ligase D [Nitrospirales bacterium]|jgi:bifunctional non-homologous end joining protein LigD